MKKLLGILIVSIFVSAVSALAVGPGVSLTFERNPQGPVEFSGTLHRKAGFSCADCHNADLFPKMEQSDVKIEMWRIFAGQQCGACHNGEGAFAAQGNCDGCHQSRN